MAKRITKDTRSTSMKKFIPNPEVNDGLVKGVFLSVEKREAEIREDSSWEIFRSKKVPRLSFVWEEFDHAKEEEPARYVYGLTAYPLDPSKSEKDDWQWNQMSQMIKHFIDVYAGEFRDEYADLLELDDTKTDYDGQMVSWNKFMDGVVTIFMGKGKELPALVGKKSWLKLLLTLKGVKVNNGDYGFPNYPGDGLVEIYEEDKKPNLRINISKGESIEAKPYESPVNLGTQKSAAASKSLPDFMKK